MSNLPTLILVLLARCVNLSWEPFNPIFRLSSRQMKLRNNSFPARRRRLIGRLRRFTEEQLMRSAK